jgi:hypothetical protein
MEKITLVEKRKVVERDPACYGREFDENSNPLQAPQRRHSFLS